MHWMRWMSLDMDKRIRALKPEGEHGDCRPGQLVWDLPVRVFHWCLLALVGAMSATGFWAPEWWLDAHVWGGYALGLLIAFRLVWGFVGGRHSRFASFPLTPAAVSAHVRSLVAGSRQSHAGHNPGGAWMILILLSLLSAIAATGVVAYGGRENLGPLAFMIDFSTGDAAGTLHEILTWMLLGAVALHILGVVVETRLSKFSLVGAMVTGRKPVSENQVESGGPLIRRGLIVASVTAVLVLAGGQGLALLPVPGWQNLEVPESYRTECGDCHDAHHPSLRTAVDWRTMMAGLADHFGEDASLEEEAVGEIRRFLEVNAATTFDTEAANRIGRAATRTGRMTDTDYWKARHKAIDPSLFRTKAVGSRINCAACHADAATGRFDDHAITLPKGE
jgi:cytochrome b